MEIKLDNVYNCDCMELMEEMRRGGVIADWLITDPPYGIKIDKTNIIKSNKSKNDLAARRDYRGQGQWDRRLTKEYFDLMFAVSKNQLIFGGNYYTDFLPPTANWMIWDKRCNILKNDLNDCEMAWVSKGGTRIFYYYYNGCMQADMKNKDERFHPTQKPTQLIGQLINYYTKKGDLILDPFMGSFTTAVSCHRQQRHFIGAELDKDYFEKGLARLQKEQAQPSIFDIIKNS